MSQGLFAPTSGPGDGIWTNPYVVIATNRADATINAGDVVQFDLTNSAATVDNNTPGSTDTSGNNSGYNCFVDPDTKDADLVSIVAGIFGIALETVAVGASCSVLIEGRTADFGITANVDAATVAGTLLIAATNNQMDVAGLIGGKIIAIAEEDDSAVTNRANVLFSGRIGFGVATAIA